MKYSNHPFYNKLSELKKSSLDENNVNEAANEDLELKSLAKKFIPIIKKYGLQIDYSTADWSKEMGRVPDKTNNVPAIVRVYNGDDSKGMLTVAIYFDTLLNSPKLEIDMGAGHSQSQLNTINSQIEKLYNELIALVPKEGFESTASSKPNKWGQYLFHFKKVGDEAPSKNTLNESKLLTERFQQLAGIKPLYKPNTIKEFQDGIQGGSDEEHGGVGANTDIDRNLEFSSKGYTVNGRQVERIKR